MAIEKPSNLAFYDRQIAPTLMRLAKRCQARGMSFLAQVEFDPGRRGKTEAVVPGIGLGMTLTHLAINCEGNIDRFVMSAANLVRENAIPHNSVILQSLGIDQDPDKRPPMNKPTTLREITAAGEDEGSDRTAAAAE